MVGVKQEGRYVLVSASVEDVFVFRQAVNEAVGGLQLDDFNERMRVTKEGAVALWQRLRGVGPPMSEYENTKNNNIEFWITVRDMHIIRLVFRSGDALREHRRRSCGVVSAPFWRDLEFPQ